MSHVTQGKSWGQQIEFQDHCRDLASHWFVLGLSFIISKIETIFPDPSLMPKINVEISWENK